MIGQGIECLVQDGCQFGPILTDTESLVGLYQGADLSRIRGELGYEPAVSLADGVAELLAWLRSQTAVDKIDQAARELEVRGLAR